MRKILIIFSIALVHYIVSILIIAAGVAYSLNRMTIGSNLPTPTILERALAWIIFFPGWLFKSSFSTDWSLLVWSGFNSLFWGFALYWIGSTAYRHFKRVKGS